MRHIQVSELWIQSKVQDHTIELVILENKVNSADAFTKHLPFTELLDCLRPLGCRHSDGRHDMAPDLSAENKQ